MDLPMRKKKKRTQYEILQKKLHNLCIQHERGLKTREEFLKAIAYSLRSIPTN